MRTQDAKLDAVKIREHVALASFTTLRVGGPARYFVEALSDADVREAVDFAPSRALPLFILGGGSNLVVADDGFAGVVLRVAIGGIAAISRTARTVVFSAAAGEDWDNFVAATVRDECAGLECLSGIPGSVGGTPVQNVGAYGQDVAETIVSVSALDLTDGSMHEFNNAQCGFSYRKSRFNSVDVGRYVILRVSFALSRSAKPKLSYADLRKYFAGRTDAPSLAEVREAVLAIRRSKGMVLDEDDPDSRSAGSFFQNPVLSESEFRTLEQRACARGLEVPSYPALAVQRKVSAAWLVEQSGYKRGFTQGQVGISSKHALAIINRGDAKAADVVALKNNIQRAVADQFGILLRPEPVFLGFREEVNASTAVQR
jgi:UDP-N-acetylmuramate dehydrogenase